MRKFLWLVIMLVLCTAIILQADVVIKQKSKVEAGGFMSMEFDGTDYYKTDKSYSGGKATVSGGMMGMMGGAEPSEYGHITRLDEKVMWQLDPENQTYTEIKMDAFKEMMDQGSMAGVQGKTEDPENLEEYEWSVDVNSSDDEVEINGFKCKNITTIANGVGKEDAEKKIRLTYEFWHTPEVPGYDELREYGEHFQKITGVNIKQSQQSAGKIFEAYGPQFDEMVELLEEADGYPIKTVIKVENTEGAQGGMPPEMMKMMGMKEKAKGEGGMAIVFSMTSEVASIEQKDVDDSRFEIPEDYKKK